MNRNKQMFFLLIVAAVAIFFLLGLGRHLSIDSLKTNREILLSFYSNHHLATVLSFMSLFIIQTGLCLPGTTIFYVGAGFLFGAIMGTVYAVTAATIGAILAFLMVRYFFRDVVQRKFDSKLSGLNIILEREGMHFILFLRLVPIFPFFLINMGAALTKLSLRTFVLVTMIGIIPSGFIYVNAGVSLATISSMGDISTPRVLGSFVLLGLFALAPVFFRRLKKTKPDSCC